MSESILITHKDKEGIYSELLPQIEAIISQETDIIANQANISAILKEAFKFLWVGFYRVDQDNDELVLGPFQGPLACTRIKFGRGVCGTAWKEEKAVIVPDVDQFPWSRRL
jgi:L-methionine (R)-S-oxide reductase